VRVKLFSLSLGAAHLVIYRIQRSSIASGTVRI